MGQGIVVLFGQCVSLQTSRFVVKFRMDKLKHIMSLAKIARPKILEKFRADSCIVSTAIGIDVLTKFGILAEPLPVQVMIFNKPFIDRIGQTGVLPTGDELKSWTKEDGSYSIGIGVDGHSKHGKWDGHLVIVAEKRYLVDLSIDQANRPDYGMVFEPIVVEVNDSFFHGKHSHIFRIASSIDANDCVFRYVAVPSNQGYHLSPDWTIYNRRKSIVDTLSLRIAASIDAEMGK